MMPTARTLGEMVDAVLMQAGPAGMRKLAQEATGSACEKCGKPAMEGSSICRECAQEQANKESEKEDGTEKTSSQRIQKLASAVAYIVNNFNGLPFHAQVGRVKIGQAPYLLSRPAFARRRGMRCFIGKMPRLPCPQARSPNSAMPSGRQ